MAQSQRCKQRRLKRRQLAREHATWACIPTLDDCTPLSALRPSLLRRRACWCVLQRQREAPTGLLQRMSLVAASRSGTFITFERPATDGRRRSALLSASLTPPAARRVVLAASGGQLNRSDANLRAIRDSSSSSSSWSRSALLSASLTPPAARPMVRATAAQDQPDSTGLRTNPHSRRRRRSSSSSSWSSGEREPASSGSRGGQLRAVWSAREVGSFVRDMLAGAGGELLVYWLISQGSTEAAAGAASEEVQFFRQQLQTAQKTNQASTAALQTALDIAQGQAAAAAAANKAAADEKAARAAAEAEVVRLKQAVAAAEAEAAQQKAAVALTKVRIALLDARNAELEAQLEARTPPAQD